MILKISPIILLLIFSKAVIAQYTSIEVIYSFKIVVNKAYGSTFYKVLKENGDSKSFVTKDTNLQSSGNIVVTKTNSKKDFGIYHDKKLDFLYEYAPIFTKDFYVKEDSLTNLFKWEFVNTTTKKILNFDCKSAICTFRGRQYTAYYADAVEFYSGPWKFTGLPGLILSISTDDGKFSFEAYSFKGFSEKIEVNNPYLKDDIKFVSFKERKKIEIKKLQDSQRNIQASEKDADVEYKFEDQSIELLKEQ
jgi:GLPGLI family protein